MRRTGSNIDWVLVGWVGAGSLPDETDPKIVYYSTDEGVTWTEMPNNKFKTWVHNPDGNFPLYCGIGNAVNVGSSVSLDDYSTINVALFGGDNIWKTNTSSEPLLSFAKIADFETSTFEIQYYNKFIDSQGCSASEAKQLRPVSGLLRADGRYYQNVVSNIDTVYKHFFGFGDGITFQFNQTPYGGFYDPTNKFPSKLLIPNAPQNLYWDTYTGWEERGFEIVKIYGGKIRGWHYGLLSAIKTKSKVVFRRNKYGQLRDMLEQRPYTKFLLTEKGTATSLPAVKVQFTSGTLAYERARDYISASNPSYNPTDSGQFDYEYKSGQPFFDDVDLNLFR
jgi:hypothetical protein